MTTNPLYNSSTHLSIKKELEDKKKHKSQIKAKQSFAKAKRKRK